MHPDLLEVAKELNLVTEYKTIRVATGEVVKVEDSISPTHQRILEAAYKAGQKSQSGCAECGCKASDGWALYCLKCSESHTEPETKRLQELTAKTSDMAAEIKRLQELADYRLKLLTKMPSERRRTND